MSKFVRNHYGFSSLNSRQKELIGNEINRLVNNKQNSHPSDLEKTAGLFYSIASSGFLIDDSIEEIMKASGEKWSRDLYNELNSLADSAQSVVVGLYEMDYSEFIKQLKAFPQN